LAFVDMAQEEGRKLRIELEEVLAQLPTMAMLVDPDGRVEYVNDALAVAMGQEPAAYPVGATNPLALDAAPKAVREAALGAIRAGKSWQGEISFPRAGNDPLRTVALFTPVQDEDGNLSHALVHLHEPNPEP
ncbi:MAG: PAS domain-containing protein, partial [Ectothiorhodospiraceae bacterium]